MIGTLKKRAMSLLMALTVLVSVSAVFESVSIKAQAYSIPASSASRDEVAGRLKVIADKWNGKNYSQMHNAGEAVYYYGDGDCFSFSKVVFEQVFGLLAYASYKSNHYEINPSNGWNDVISLVGQAAGTNSAAISKNVLSNALPGDIVIGKLSKTPHVMVVYSTGDNTGIRFLDCNNDTHNTVALRYETYATFASRYSKFSLYRAVNYPLEAEKPVPTISAPKTQDEVVSRLNTLMKGEYGKDKTFPYSSTPVPAYLAGEAGGTRTDGYARYVFYQLFGIPMSAGVSSNQYQLTNSNGNLKTIASCSGTSTAATMKADVFKAKPGDIIQGKGNGFYQTMVVVSYNENGITILDCDNDYKNGIELRTRDWSKFAGSFKQYTIYRSVNYPNSTPTEVTKPGTSSKPKADVNDDGKEDVSDVVIFIARFLSGSAVDLKKYDFNGDGKIDVDDVMSLMDILLS